MYDAELDEETNWRILRASLVLETGLPFEYWDGVSVQDMGDIVGYKSGTSKVQDRVRRDANRARS